ncbi:TRAP transporter small permease [Ramlibacter rhizophilus]|uniref:TRAP transporter small permease protein n=1 Tax=Ramlibacter rhizophilus TaxID=1781167 RepID=A0A4Z0BPB9_9BURK|nr:TRAP transporter small permease [Ramlibacter rhizophilus]TFZ01156.1 TRAP transporter small permease [Ramlibacter rhizophilus]
MGRLHWLYRAAGLLSALCLVLICGLILAQVIARNLGSTVRDAEEFAAWSMAAAGFFGLAYTLHSGAHIRVQVTLRFLPARAQRAVEIVATAIALAIAAYLAWFCVAFVWESYTFKEVSQGLVPVPMWVPQLPMAIGSTLLVVAFAERLVCVLKGRTFELADSAEMSE